MAIYIFLCDDSDADVVMRNETIDGGRLTDIRRLLCVLNGAVCVCVFFFG